MDEAVATWIEAASGRRGRRWSLATVEATTVVMVAAHGEVKPDDGVGNGREVLGVAVTTWQ